MQVPLSDWSAWAPGLYSFDDWDSYLNGRKSLCENDSPDVSFLPAMFRRKLSILSRMVFCTYNQLSKKLNSPPLVFASRHGELSLSTDLINYGINSAPYSPAKFSISVHNSPVGLLSIQNKNTSSSTAISSGKRTLEMGLIEAIAVCKEVGKSLLIYADLPLTDEYKDYEDEQTFPICLAMYLENNAASQEINFDQAGSFQALQLIEQLIQK